MIVDNYEISYMLQKHNGIPIKGWYGDKADTELHKLAKVLKKLATYQDVRKGIRKLTKNGFVDYKGFVKRPRTTSKSKTMKKSKSLANQANFKVSNVEVIGKILIL